jgi:hypothetical protein
VQQDTQHRHHHFRKLFHDYKQPTDSLDLCRLVQRLFQLLNYHPAVPQSQNPSFAPERHYHLMQSL